VVAVAASRAMIVTTTMTSARAETARAKLFNAEPIIIQDSGADSRVTKKSTSYGEALNKECDCVQQGAALD
jgi:hypothetical protein